MAAVTRPGSEAELAEAIAGAAGPFEIIGAATKRTIGRPVQAAQTLDLSGFAQVEIYEPEELILEIGAGARLADVEALIESRNQHLAFEPPDLSAVLGSTGSGTIGGLVASNLSGPRRIKAGAVRDHILGIRGVTGGAQAFKAGARVVKNVTGFDLPKLMTGSFGTLAALTSVILKVLPKPETEETIVITGQDDAAAVQLMSLAMQSASEVSSAAYVPGEGVYLRLEGIAPSVAYRRDQLAKALGHPVQVMAAKSSSLKWAAIRDALMFADDPARPLWRLSVTPSDAPRIVEGIRNETELRYFLDWAGGLIWLDLPDSADAGAALVRGAMPSGHATLIRAPEAARASIEVFQPQDRALSALSARVKASFDPNRIFNPGRMYRDI